MLENQKFMNLLVLLALAMVAFILSVTYFTRNDAIEAAIRDRDCTHYITQQSREVWLCNKGEQK